MGKCKAKAIRADLGAFRHNRAWYIIWAYLFRHIRAYSGPCVSLVYLRRLYVWGPGIFAGLVCSGAPCVGGAGIFGSGAYSGPCQASAMGRFAGVVGGCGYFLGSWLFSRCGVVAFSGLWGGDRGMVAWGWLFCVVGYGALGGWARAFFVFWLVYLGGLRCLGGRPLGSHGGCYFLFFFFSCVGTMGTLKLYHNHIFIYSSIFLLMAIN